MTLPRRLQPMKATSGTLPPDDGWAFEIKWDGVRAIAYVEDGRLSLESRNLIDITARYPEVQPLAAHLAGRDAVLDGEVVAFDERGRPDFSTLQRRMHVGDARTIQQRMLDTPVLYAVFDVLHLDGAWVGGRPWHERRALLESLELSGPAWRVPAAHVGGGAGLLDATRGQGLEGVIAKRVGSPYVPGRRSPDWVKVKNVLRQEVVVGGWLPGQGRRANGLGALLVGVHDDSGAAPGRGARPLRYVGRVGTGFTDAELDRVAGLLDALARPSSPFADTVPHRDARFVEPRLVAEVEFTEWTPDGSLRHPSYKGMRDDKDPGEVVRET